MCDAGRSVLIKEHFRKYQSLLILALIFFLIKTIGLLK